MRLENLLEYLFALLKKKFDVHEYQLVEKGRKKHIAVPRMILIAIVVRHKDRILEYKPIPELLSKRFNIERTCVSSYNFIWSRIFNGGVNRYGNYGKIALEIVEEADKYVDFYEKGTK